MSDEPERQYAEGGYIGPIGPGFVLIHPHEHFISSEQLARLGLDYIERAYRNDEEDVD